MSFLQAIATAAYVAVIGWLLYNGQMIFDRMQTVLAPIAFLMLFVLSAAITGTLVLGRPVLWYLSDRRSEAVTLFSLTLGWLTLFTLLLLTTQVLF